MGAGEPHFRGIAANIIRDMHLSANHGPFVSEPPEPSICITLEGKMLWLATAAKGLNGQNTSLTVA